MFFWLTILKWRKIRFLSPSVLKFSSPAFVLELFLLFPCLSWTPSLEFTRSVYDSRNVVWMDCPHDAKILWCQKRSRIVCKWTERKWSSLWVTCGAMWGRQIQSVSHECWLDIGLPLVLQRMCQVLLPVSNLKLLPMTHFFKH